MNEGRVRRRIGISAHSDAYCATCSNFNIRVTLTSFLNIAFIFLFAEKRSLRVKEEAPKNIILSVTWVASGPVSG